MRAFTYLLFIVCLSNCFNSQSEVSETKQTNTITPIKLSVLVLTPYDEISNGGFSPDIQKYLEMEISKDTNLNLIKFPYKQLTNVPYQNVFDKKYCKPILNKVKANIIVMSKLDLVSRGSSMTDAKWNLRIRIYNTNTNQQLDSKIKADSLSDGAIKDVLILSYRDLMREIKNIQ